MAYENDFMDFNYLVFNQFLTNLTAFETWLGGMTRAAHKWGLPVQLCMSLPNEVLLSLKHSAITNARASEDNYPGNAHPSAWERGSRWQSAYTHVFYAAVNIAPFFDVVWTMEHCDGAPYDVDRDNIFMQVRLGGKTICLCFVCVVNLLLVCWVGLFVCLLL